MFMKKHILPILFFLTLVLFSCGSGTTTQNSGDISNAPASTETEYTGEGALPELVFDNLTFSEIEYYEHA